VDVSVIVPTYRRERQVVDALRSALAQNGPSLEVFVFDDDPSGSAREARSKREMAAHLMFHPALLINSSPRF
jgi:glycosyltransferase involved in cell wall biosynthesis